MRRKTYVTCWQEGAVKYSLVSGSLHTEAHTHAHTPPTARVADCLLCHIIFMDSESKAQTDQDFVNSCFWVLRLLCVCNFWLFVSCTVREQACVTLGRLCEHCCNTKKHNWTTIHQFLETQSCPVTSMNLDYRAVWALNKNKLRVCVQGWCNALKVTATCWNWHEKIIFTRHVSAFTSKCQHLSPLLGIVCCQKRYINIRQECSDFLVSVKPPSGHTEKEKFKALYLNMITCAHA